MGATTAAGDGIDFGYAVNGMADATGGFLADSFRISLWGFLNAGFLEIVSV